MARTRVVAGSWPRALGERFRSCVPPEGRSAFIVRAMMRAISTIERAGLKGIEWTATSVEAFARAWLMGVLAGASMDPRGELAWYTGAEFILNMTLDDQHRVGKDKADEGLPPVLVSGVELVRRPRTNYGGQDIPGTETYYFRFPEASYRELLYSVPRERSAFCATAVERELDIVEVVDARLKRTKDTMTVFGRGIELGQQHGFELLRDSRLDARHIEDLVAREIAAYLLAPRIVGRR